MSIAVNIANDKNSIMKIKDIFRSKKNESPTEYVGVFVGKDGSFSFDTISEKKYNGILTDRKPVAGFAVSQIPFDGNRDIEHNDADRLTSVRRKILRQCFNY